MTVPLIICGAQGRMGRAVIDLAALSDRFSIKAGVVNEVSAGKDENPPCPFYNSLDEALSEAAKEVAGPLIVIDFSQAALALPHLGDAIKHKSGFLLATTGHSDALMPALWEAAKSIPIVVAPNTSLMANVMMLLCQQAASVLKDTSASIVDLHHAHKQDAPSGTAKALIKAINQGQQNLKPIPVHSLRQGTVAGEHTVYFFNQFERLEITHRAEDRRIFAQGALVAAEFLHTRSPGLYEMKDVINLNLNIENRA